MSRESPRAAALYAAEVRREAQATQHADRQRAVAVARARAQALAAQLANCDEQDGAYAAAAAAAPSAHRGPHTEPPFVDAPGGGAVERRRARAELDTGRASAAAVRAVWGGVSAFDGDCESDGGESVLSSRAEELGRLVNAGVQAQIERRRSELQSCSPHGFEEPPERRLQTAKAAAARRAAELSAVLAAADAAERRAAWERALRAGLPDAEALRRAWQATQAEARAKAAAARKLAPAAYAPEEQVRMRARTRAYSAPHALLPVVTRAPWFPPGAPAARLRRRGRTQATRRAQPEAWRLPCWRAWSSAPAQRSAQRRHAQRRRSSARRRQKR
jgi:hypothetical protein